MKKSILILPVLLILLMPVVFSITLQDLINFFSFNFFTAAINVTGHNDSIIDQDNNGINDILIIELATDGNSGNYLIVVDLYDQNIITNETNKTLNSGINKFDISFSTEFFTKNKFNYTIKIYDEGYSLKYSKENIETNYYANYEEGVKILNISDKSINNFLQLNLTINFSKNNPYEIIAYLQHNDSTIFSKINKTANPGINHIIINFDNQTIKNTLIVGQLYRRHPDTNMQ